MHSLGKLCISVPKSATATESFPSLVLRDDAGAIVYGYSTFVDWPSEGGSRPFSMDVIDPPAYDSFEVHVQPW